MIKMEGNITPNSNPSRIGEDAMVQALSYPQTPYFITSNLYWDCNCRNGYIHPFGMPMCEECGTMRDEAPPSRINEMKFFSIHLDLHAPDVVSSLEEHNVLTRLA